VQSWPRTEVEVKRLIRGDDGQSSGPSGKLPLWTAIATALADLYSRYWTVPTRNGAQEVEALAT
jgi:hypothetical protein